MLYMENHDHPRIISRYGSEEFREQSGKSIATAYLFQKGTPFLYQGQEIGMINWRPASADLYEDVQTRYIYEHNNLNKSEEVRLRKMWRSSRDSARTPVQWDATDNAGFSTTEPWFSVNENYREINVAAQETNPQSLLHFYRKAIALRKSLHAVRHGIYKEHFHKNKQQYVYSMTSSEEKLLIVCSFSKHEQKMKIPKGFDLKKSELLLCGEENPDCTILKPYESRVYRIL